MSDAATSAAHRPDCFYVGGPEPHGNEGCRQGGPGDDERRKWGVSIRGTYGTPMLSLGIHIDLHTPTLDLHLGWACIQVGRNMWDGRRFAFEFQRWHGHSDNCDRLCSGVLNA